MVMRWFKPIVIVVLVFVIPGLFVMHDFYNEEEVGSLIKVDTKINGVNFVSSREPMQPNDALSVKSLGSNYIAIIPYAFVPGNVPKVIFDVPQQWYGERVEGSIQMINTAKTQDLKIMLKPHLWVRGDGWAGDLQMENETDWQKWEKEFSKYVMTYAHIADSLDVEIFCIATECRQVVKQRPEFWLQLIKDVRQVYDGKLTYAANWDNFQNVSFWDQLDYIGIDAYFPISSEQTPNPETLMKGWKPIKSDLKSLVNTYKKPLLFTEFGYQSIDFTASEHWNIDNNGAVNLKGQENAYYALMESFWNESWFAGGFLWKWFPNHEVAGGHSNKRYTPQNKPAEQLVRRIYSQVD